MRLSTGVAIIAVSSSLSLRAQQPVNLNLRCPAPCSYRQGESIWLDMDFTTSTPYKYSVLTNYTDRDMAGERFWVTPEAGTSDPLAPYLPLVRAVAGSLNFGTKPLSEIPVSIRINSNQWIRFDRPGVYRVTVNSSRVKDAGRVTSNEIRITITAADPQWQKEQLGYIYSIYESDQVHALCDLGTEAAAIEMVGRLGGDPHTVRLYEMGIIRSPYRAAAIREMARLIAAPDAPITDMFLDAMANVSVEPNSDPMQMRYAAMAKRSALRQELVDAIPAKRGAGLSISANTLLHWQDLRPSDHAKITAIIQEAK